MQSFSKWIRLSKDGVLKNSANVKFLAKEGISGRTLETNGDLLRRTCAGSGMSRSSLSCFRGEVAVARRPQHDRRHAHRPTCSRRTRGGQKEGTEESCKEGDAGKNGQKAAKKKFAQKKEEVSPHTASATASFFKASESAPTRKRRPARLTGRFYFVPLAAGLRAYPKTRHKA